MEPLGPGQVMFRIHGPASDGDEPLKGLVFAAKLGALIRGLYEADRAINGVLWHDYSIAKLRSSSPTVILTEQPRPRFEGELQAPSAIDAYDDCAEAIAVGDHERALRYGKCAAYISSLARGANRKFGYAELWTGRERVIRIDPFLVERAKAIVSPQAPIAQPDAPWFKGAAHGSFDGTVQVADLRGALPEIRLILSAGGKQIACVCHQDDIEKIRAALNRRVRITGRAIYDGKSGLPRRVEVSDIEILGGEVDFSRWRGAFEPFDLPEWEGDDT